MQSNPMDRRWMWIVTTLLGGALGCASVPTESEGEGDVIGVATEGATACPPLFKTWEDPTVYPATANPYRRKGFYHPMSYASGGGVTIAHGSRIGEACSYLDGGFHIQTRLKSNCAGGSCIGICIP